MNGQPGAKMDWKDLEEELDLTNAHLNDEELEDIVFPDSLTVSQAYGSLGLHCPA